MEITFDLQNGLGRTIQEQPSSKEFVVKSMQKALLEQWQDEEVRKGMAEAEAGDFASSEEVEKFFNKWVSNAGG